MLNTSTRTGLRASDWTSEQAGQGSVDEASTTRPLPSPTRPVDVPCYVSANVIGRTATVKVALYASLCPVSFPKHENNQT
eukprot:scaffold158019_cov48-Prasinocladus_malaysianus.AAC.1